MTLAAYLMIFLLHYAPPEVHDYTGVAREETVARYEAIARAIATASTEAPLFAGSDGAAKTALLAASVALFESGQLRREVDVCEDGGDKRDGEPHSWSIFQLQEPWTPKSVACSSRLSAARAAIDAMRASIEACHALSQDRRLAMFASGRCDSEAGQRASVNRWRRATAWWLSHPYPQEGT